jgi:D-alanyl-lipoteichoic acid acyltransferase DltB (MBOAT superfamily)
MVYNQVFFGLFSLLAALAVSRQKGVLARHLSLAAANGIFLLILFFWSGRSLAMLVGLLAIHFAGLKLVQAGKGRLSSACAALLVALDVAALILSNFYQRGSSLFFLVGSSLLVLRLIHLAVEAGRGELTRPVTPLRFLGFTLFFPAYLSGPIARYDDFVSQFEAAKPLTAESAYRSIVRITLGFFKVQVLAFLLSPVSVHMAASLARDPTSQAATFGVFALFGVWLYLSFSGVTDVAIGVGQLMGVKLPENFDKPFTATNLADFWKRWHVSLLEWARQYLFAPLLGISRAVFPAGPFVCTTVAVLGTFALLGVWHGPGGHFLHYGLYHGIGILIFLAYERTLRSSVKRFCSASQVRLAGANGLAWVLTWTYVTAGWFFYLDQEGALYRLLRLR